MNVVIMNLMVWYSDKKTVMKFKILKKSGTGLTGAAIGSKSFGPVPTGTGICSTKLDRVFRPAQAFVYVCTYVRMFVCACTCAGVYTHTHIYKYIYLYIYMCNYVCMYACVYIHLLYTSVIALHCSDV